MIQETFASSQEDDELDQPKGNKFSWRDRVGCVEAIALICDDNGGKFDQAIRGVRLAVYAYNVKRMPVKQRNQLRRDTMKRLKDIRHMRESARIGDVVRVPKLIDNPLIGGYKKEGRKLVDAIILDRTQISSAYRYRVKRLDDNQIQIGNGHMIKAIVSRANESEGVEHENH
ncbi:hypothetical protein [Paenibacillus sp. NPDC057967]|uniref:hypothetical protein n=1 Tax=Paenibacillus sp. NPDC057967 TaxID=3346293 RepID=UPI0036D903DF